MRVVFCGSGPFAVPSLKAIAASGAHELALVVTQPARPAGRGGKLHSTPVRQFAEGSGLSVREIEKINAPECVAMLAGFKADVMAVADFGQFIRAPAREAFRLGAFNVHGSALPELRGAAPVNWAIIRGYRRTGVTTFSLVDAMDAGPVFLTAQTPIDPHERADELRARLAEMGAELALRTLELLGAGVRPQPQDESKATRAPLLKKEDGRVDFSLPAESVRALVHGAWPWPGAQAAFSPSGRKTTPVTLARAEALDAPHAPPPEAPGTVDADLCVACAGGRLRILEIHPAGKRVMAWKDFANGYRVAPGDRFLPP